MKNLTTLTTILIALLFVSVLVAAQTSAPPSPSAIPVPTAPTGLDMKMVQSILDKRSKEIDARDVDIEILTAQRDFYRGRVAELEVEVSKMKPTKSQ